jgi:hypothetical protein
MGAEEDHARLTWSSDPTQWRRARDLYDALRKFDEEYFNPRNHHTRPGGRTWFWRSPAGFIRHLRSIQSILFNDYGLSWEIRNLSPILALVPEFTVYRFAHDMPNPLLMEEEPAEEETPQTAYLPESQK